MQSKVEKPESLFHGIDRWRDPEPARLTSSAVAFRCQLQHHGSDVYSLSHLTKLSDCRCNVSSIFRHRSAPTTARGYRRSVPRYRRKLHNLRIAHCHFVRELLLTVRLDTHAEAKSSRLRRARLNSGLSFPSVGAAATTEIPSESSPDGHLVSATVLPLRRLPN